MRSSLPLALLLVAGCASTPPEPPGPHEQYVSCTLIGCTTGMTLLMTADISREQLQASTLTICRNDVCYPTRLAGLRAGMQWPEPVGRLGKPTMELQVQSLEEGVQGLLIYYLSNDDDGWKDGDVFVVTLKGGDGRSIVNFRGTARYQTVQPNGPLCDGTCHVAVFIEAGGDWPNRPRPVQ
ncbi:hypothetical protein D7V97_20440 [Corallococcus sp. CA053C]|nr:hypothetical protein D7V97_20440 [Corallococcus sp. CA053C]